MKPASFAAVIEAMKPAASRIQAEIDLIVEMKAARVDESGKATDALLTASGGFYATYSAYALENSLSDAYEALLTAWIGVGIAYDKGLEGEDFSDAAFEMYRVITDHRISID